MRNLGYVLVGLLLIFPFLLCVLALAICVVAALEYPASFCCGIAVASAVAGFWKIGDVACSQFMSLFW